MKKLRNTWLTGLDDLVNYDLISYFAFITTALTEIAFLWAFKDTIALPFTIILVGCVLNVISNGILCRYVFKNGGMVRIAIYIGIFVGLFIYGCTVHWITTIILYAVLFGTTGLWMYIHMFQICEVGEPFSENVTKISEAFSNKRIFVRSQVLIILIPIGIATAFFAMTNVCLAYKIVLPILYVLICPFISYFEEECAEVGVFELFLPFF